MPAVTVYAAGVLCWRETADGVLVLLVRRPDYGDVSIPKGKLDPGELLPETAARELVEETGVRTRLGAPIGEARYRVKSGPKAVRYWLAEVDDEQAAAAEFTPNAEISAVEWLPLAAAKQQVTYPYDAELIGELERRLKAGTARTFSVAIARHGKALPAGDWDGPDSTRPLMQRGREQAETIAPSLAAFGPERIVTSPAIRCRATIAPLAALEWLPVKESTSISQDAHEAGLARPGRQIAKRLRKREPVVLCSHGPVIPELTAAIVREAGTGAASASVLRRAAALATGSFAVFHLTDAETPRLVDVEVHDAG